MKDTKSITDISILKKGLEYQKELDYNVACKESKHLAILIQHLKGIKTMKELLDDKDFLKDDLILALFQLYAPLSLLMNDFTHYDLHYENVQLYEPAQDKYIQYHYHYANGNTISFKTKYMVKIIDYGRCYINGMNAKNIHENKLCNKAVTPECNKRLKCGYDEGFTWLENDKRDNNASNYFISSQIRNASHDLRALKTIKDYFLSEIKKGNLLTADIPLEIRTLLLKLVYDKQYGMPENLNMGYPDLINNVEDALMFITELMSDRDFVKNNGIVYKNKNKLGDLHIYMDGASKPMKFVPV